jgi:hypothetical protein
MLNHLQRYHLIKAAQDTDTFLGRPIEDIPVIETTETEPKPKLPMPSEEQGKGLIHKAFPDYGKKKYFEHPPQTLKESLEPFKKMWKDLTN